jgi:hypothetical protein
MAFPSHFTTQGEKTNKWPIWKCKQPYRQGEECIYDTYQVKIVFGVSANNTLYVRGEQKSHPRKRFGPWPLHSWTHLPGLQCTGNVCCNERGFCFANEGTSQPPTILTAPIMAIPVFFYQDRNICQIFVFWARGKQNQRKQQQKAGKAFFVGPFFLKAY